MKRRVFLATSGTGLLAGCNDIQEPTNTDTPQDTVEDQNDDETEQVGPEAEIRIDSDDWIVEGESVEYILGNHGEGQSGSVNLVTRWYDEAGNYIGNDQVSVPTLRSGGSWFIQVKTTAPFEVAAYDAYVDYQSQYSYKELETSSVEIDQQRSAITGIVSHGQEDETGIEIQAVTYSSGWITHAGFIRDSRVPDEDWRFILPLSQVGSDETDVGEDVELMFHVR
jgi:hypothetical protein